MEKKTNTDLSILIFVIVVGFFILLYMVNGAIEAKEIQHHTEVLQLQNALIKHHQSILTLKSQLATHDTAFKEAYKDVVKHQNYIMAENIFFSVGVGVVLLYVIIVITS